MWSFRLPTKAACTSPVIVSFDARGNTFTVSWGLTSHRIIEINHQSISGETFQSGIEFVNEGPERQVVLAQNFHYFFWLGLL